MDKSFYQNKLVLLILLLGFIGSIFFINSHLLVVDAMQIIERGFLFTKGYLVPFGPRSTNTNMIYGPFLSLMSGLSLSIVKHPMSIAVMILFTQFIGVILLLKTKILNQNYKFILAYLLLYWVSPWRASEAFVWNASFLFFTSSLFFYSLDRLFTQENRVLFTVLHGLSYILTFQVHNSVIIFAPITLYYMYKRKLSLSVVGILICCVIFGLMITPTAYLIYNNPEILNYNRSSDKAYLFRNLVTVFEMIKGVAYWLRYPSLYFGATIFQLPKLDFANALIHQKIWFIVKWLIAISSLIGVIVSNRRFFKSSQMSDLKELCKVVFFSLVFISAMSPVSFNFWHLYLIYPFSIIPVAFFVSSSKHFNKIMAFLAVYFIVFSFIESRKSYKHNSSIDQAKEFKTKVIERENDLIKKYETFSVKMF